MRFFQMNLIKFGVLLNFNHKLSFYILFFLIKMDLLSLFPDIKTGVYILQVGKIFSTTTSTKLNTQTFLRAPGTVEGYEFVSMIL